MRGSRASPSNYYPLLSDYSRALAKRGLESARAAAAVAAAARPPGPAPARAHPRGHRRPRAGGSGGAAGARSAAAAWGNWSLHFPLVPPSPCQPGVRVFVFTSKRPDTKVENESDEQTKEAEGLRNKVVPWPQRLRGAGGERKYLGNLCKSTASPKSYVIFQNASLSHLISGHQRISHNFFKLQN